MQPNLPVDWQENQPDGRHFRVQTSASVSATVTGASADYRKTLGFSFGFS
jgi:hypothetical protein